MQLALHHRLTSIGIECKDIKPEKRDKKVLTL